MSYFESLLKIFEINCLSFACHARMVSQIRQHTFKKATENDLRACVCMSHSSLSLKC